MLAQLKIMCVVFLYFTGWFVADEKPLCPVFGFAHCFFRSLADSWYGNGAPALGSKRIFAGGFPSGGYAACSLSDLSADPAAAAAGVTETVWEWGTLLTLFLIYTGFKLHGVGGMILALLIGTIFMSLYRMGLFDEKIQKISKLIYAYRHYGEEQLPRS